MDENRNQHTIVFLTPRFPFPTDRVQLLAMADIEAASQSFHKVIVVPTGQCDTCAIVCDKPSNVEIDLSLTYKHSSKLERLRGFFKPEVWRMAKGNLSLKNILFSSDVGCLDARLKNWITRRNIDMSSTFFYVLDSDIAARALSELKNDRFRHLKFVTSCIAQSDGIVSLSAMSTDLAGPFRQFTPRSVKLMGAKSATFNKSSNHKLTILSASTCSDDSRLQLTAGMLAGLATAREGDTVKWIHLGNSDETKAVTKWLESRSLPSNFKWESRRDAGSCAMQRLFLTEPIDWFVSLGKGTGSDLISICEALSYGVPLILSEDSRAVDLCADDSTVIMPVNVSREEFVRGMAPYLDSDHRHESMGRAALEKWRDSFDAISLSKKFFNDLANGQAD